MLANTFKFCIRFEQNSLLNANFGYKFNSKILPSLTNKDNILRNGIVQVPLVNIHTTPPSHLFWEKEPKGGYDTKPKVKTSNFEHIRSGLKELKTEISLWKEEVIEKFEGDPLVTFRPGETDVIWCFDNQNILDGWTTTCDSDHNEGNSKCSFEMSKSGRGLFSGFLDCKTPKDGKLKRSGYCNIRSKRYRKSFKREGSFDWGSYNTLVLKIRGDGRSYMVNLSAEGYWDLAWNDIYHYALYTRGGPYWQIAKIPFSKFFLGSKGRVQDRQSRVPLHRLTHVGITCADKIPGDFALEVEYIGIEFDPTHDEEFAYEMYKTDKHIAGF